MQTVIAYGLVALAALRMMQSLGLYSRLRRSTQPATSRPGCGGNCACAGQPIIDAP